MANDCNYEMKIKGSKETIQRVIDCLKANYNYYEGKPAHKHFFRVFECVDEDEYEIYGDNGDGTFTAFVWGYCAWSVWSCMMKGEHTYYDDVKRNHPDTFMGTCLEEQSQDCEIEVFSEEPGMGFSEHYYFKNGVCLIDTSVEMREEWDEEYEECELFNPNRENNCDGFKFIL